jgi:signal transduction histidine kinase
VRLVEKACFDFLLPNDAFLGGMRPWMISICLFLILRFHYSGWNAPLWLCNYIRVEIINYGSGIPEGIRDKIFQSFFTTKPAGQGTGLCLSLVYDIIKAHAGEIKVNSQEGKSSTFIVQLPVANSSTT